MSTFTVGSLPVHIAPDRALMGQAAAEAGVKLLKALLQEHEEVNVVFAAAPSQAEMMQALVDAKDVDWGRVNAFHMDNYIGLPDEDPRQFSAFLKKRLFAKLPFNKVHYMGIQRSDAQAYAGLLAGNPIHLCFMGIGENAHIAFNDPGNAFFEDRETVKEVALDYACRMQQVNEGNFPRLEDVPTHAITLTIPTLMSAEYVICTVPGENKAAAVQCMLEGPISESCPASVLRRHPHAALYLDEAAASKLEGKRA